MGLSQLGTASSRMAEGSFELETNKRDEQEKKKTTRQLFSTVLSTHIPLTPIVL